MPEWLWAIQCLSAQDQALKPCVPRVKRHKTTQKTCGYHGHSALCQTTKKGVKRGKKIAMPCDCRSPAGKPWQKISKIFPQKSGEIFETFCHIFLEPPTDVPRALPRLPVPPGPNVGTRLRPDRATPWQAGITPSCPAHETAEQRLAISPCKQPSLNPSKPSLIPDTSIQETGYLKQNLCFFQRKIEEIDRIVTTDFLPCCFGE